MYQEPQFASDLLVMMFLTAIAFIRPDSPIVAALTTIVIPVAMVARSDDVRFVASWVLFLAHWCYIVGCFFFAALIFLLFGIVAVLVPLLVWQEVKSLQCKAKARFAAYVLRRNANPGRRRHARRQLQAPRDAIEKELRLIKLLDSSCANLWEAVEAEKPRVLKAFDFAPPKADWYPAAELLRTCLPCGSRIPVAPRTLEEHDRTKNYESDERLPDALTCFNHQIDIEVCRLELEVEDLNGIYEHNDRIKEALWSEKEKSLKTFKWFVKFLGERGMIFTNTPRKDYDGSDLLPSSLVFEPLNFQKKQPQGPLTLKRPKVQWSELPQPKFTELVGSLFPNESPAQPLAQEAPVTPSQEERGPDTAHTSGSEQGTKGSDPCGFPFGPCHHIPEHLKLDLTPVHESEESGPDTAHTSTDQNAEALTPDHEESGPDTAHTSGPLSNGEDPILSDDGDDDWVTTDDEDEEPILSDDGDEDWVTTDSDDDDDDDDEDDNDADAGIPSGPASSPLPPLPPSSPFPPTPVPAVFTAPTVAASPSPSAEPALPPSPRLIPLPPSPPLPALPALPLAPPAPSSTGPVSQAAAAGAPEPVAPAQSTSSNPFLSATPSLPVWFPAPTTPPAAPVSASTFVPFVPVSSSFPPVPSSLFPPTPLQLVPSSSIPPNPQVAAPVVISEQQMDTDSDEEEGIEFEDVPIGQGNGTSEDEDFQMDQDTQVDDEGNMDIDSRPAKDEDTMSDGDEEAMLVNSENSAPSATDDVHEQGQAHDGNNDQGDNDPVDSSAAADSDSDVSEADIAEMNAASFGDDWVPGQSTSAPGPTNNAAQGSSSAQPTPQRSPFAASSSSSQSAQPAQRAQPSYLAAPQASSLGFTASGTPPPPASSAVSQTSPVMYFGPVRAQPSSFVAAPQLPVSYGFTASTSAARFSPFAAPQAPPFGFTATAPSVRPSPFAAPQTSSFGFTATAPVTRPSPFAAPQASSPGFTASTSPPRPSASAAPQSGFTATAPRVSSSSASANAVATSSTAPSAATAGPSTSSSFTFAGSFSTAANTFDSASIFGSAMSELATRFDWAPRPQPGSGVGAVNNPFVQAPAFGTALAPLAILMEPMRSAVRVAVESWRQQGATKVADELEANWETMFRKVAQSKANGNADKKLATTMEEAKAVVRHFVYRVGQMRSLQKAPEQVVEEFRDNLWSAIIAQDFLPDDDDEEEEEAQFAPMPEEEANDEDSESEVSEEE